MGKFLVCVGSGVGIFRAFVGHVREGARVQVSDKTIAVYIRSTVKCGVGAFSNSGIVLLRNHYLQDAMTVATQDMSMLCFVDAAV